MIRLSALAILALASCGSPAAPTLDPISAEETRPLFLFNRSALSAGYDGHGFVIQRDGQRPLGITAYHVAGSFVPTGPVDPAAPQVTAWLRTIVDTPIVVRLGERLSIPGAQTITAGNSQHDVAAFTVLDFIPARSLELATDLPPVGDTVYVLALHIGDHPRSGPRRHPALVTVSTDTDFRYRYLLSANANMTSGAAVLDSQGRVVGLNVGTIGSGDQVFGLAVGIRSLRALLPE